MNIERNTDVENIEKIEQASKGGEKRFDLSDSNEIASKIEDDDANNDAFTRSSGEMPKPSDIATPDDEPEESNKVDPFRNSNPSETASEHRFEKYSSEAAMTLAQDNPEAAEALNHDYQEKVSAEKLGYTQDEYRAHLQRIEDANQPEQLTPQEADKVRDIVYSHFDAAQSVAHNATLDGTADGEKDYKGENFTDHNKEHVEQVLDKTTEAAKTFVEAINEGKMENNEPQGDVHFSADVDYKVVQAAALSHDTGMSDNGYSRTIDAENKTIAETQNRYDFNSVRGNHNVNSALNVLENREQYKEIGFTDNQVDEIAALCYAHSKSSSGISNLNDNSTWNEGFNRLDTFVEAYNKDHPDSPICYDREYLESRMGALATEGLALRVGDVSRDSGPDAIAQGGNVIHVDKVLDDPANSYKSEVNNYAVIRDDGYEITDEKSKQVHIGEQNIVENHTEFKDGAVTHTITVNDGKYAPYCTVEAIKDHLGEFASAKDGNFVVSIEFDKPYDDTIKELYNTFRREVRDDYVNVSILYPWNQED